MTLGHFGVASLAVLFAKKREKERRRSLEKRREGGRGIMWQESMIEC